MYERNPRSVQFAELDSVAICHADLDYDVITEENGDKYLRVNVSDRYVYENDLWLFWSTGLKAGALNVWARTAQGTGELNPFSWSTEPIKIKLK